MDELDEIIYVLGRLLLTPRLFDTGQHLMLTEANKRIEQVNRELRTFNDA